MQKRSLVAWLGLYLTFFASIAQASPQTLSQDDLIYRAALYDYHLKNYQSARTQLLRAKTEQQKDSVYRQMLLARVYVEEGRFEQAQEVFSSVRLDDIPVALRNDTLFALARLYYAEGECKQAIKTLEQAKKLSAAQDPQARFIRSSCLLADGEKNLSKVGRAEKVLNDGLGNLTADTAIWFAYGYLNIAVLAGELKNISESDRLFNEALRYTGVSEEGLALAERIRLSRAEVNYELNRYDFAMNAYQEIAFNGYWQDRALLGYGWSAFHNYKPDVALEAWRQLANLSFKSMSVYQAYLLIPFAYERANAFTQALEAYDAAIKQYLQISEEIDAFGKSLDLAKVQTFAVRYYRQKESAEPIHPLLSATYIQPDFRHLIEQVGMLTAYQQRLSEYQIAIAMFENYANVYERQAEQRANWRAGMQDKVAADLKKLQQNTPSVIDSVLENELNNPNDNSKLKGTYQQYKSSKSRLTQGADELRDRVERLQGVIWYQLAESKTYEHASDMNQLSARQQTLLVRFNEYLALTQQSFDSSVSQQEYNDIKAKLSALQKDVDVSLRSAQEILLQKTQEALLEQRRFIETYESQARIARANLKEEFYQRGGSRLWY